MIILDSNNNDIALYFGGILILIILRLNEYLFLAC